ncbi:efflux RND transporter periplasmic adaptor subunit [Blastopirellula marina]|uniref:Efflux RND transporter periplasmic adaptor subunit n=1 Tax=Blastopirellula marina TaxID=124 RepID=A0A2S8G2Z8_9BACT|nr:MULTISPECIES: efflux RND transporter periplasmic adaptor subunit [Pirellulaceae]PQO38836.1 efflux RND transporter periplasmic adaptor subunit [Blastopirellula marina]RCS55144.1 efflux RND transporter periplasmic adaptor subunit [Bremerella cremea]
MTSATLGNMRSLILLVVLAVFAIAAGMWWVSTRATQLSHQDTGAGAEHEPDPHAPQIAANDPTAETIEFPQHRWEAGSVVIEPVQLHSFEKRVEVTGKIAINEDRLAHIFPLAEGVVDEVTVHLGDQVKKKDVLAIVQSREVGQAKLQLYQDRLKLDQISAQDKWTQQIVTNVQELIEMIRAEAEVSEIEERFRGKPIGEYRNQLLTAYIGKHTHQQTVSRLSPLSQTGAVSGKQLIQAESDSNTARATLQSLIEQIQQEAVQESLRSSHAVKEMETRVAVDEAALKVLGFDQEALEEINPVIQGEAVSHMPIFAPFDGTIISKDVVLAERVGPESQIFSVADLSTVWVTADIYEGQLPLLSQARGKTIQLKADAWPGRTFDAKVFYTGDLVDPDSRTLTLRAVADNQDAALKPGMFVHVLFPTSDAGKSLQIPATALQDFEGRNFVFLHLGGDLFEARDVTLGRKTENMVEIVEGLKEGDQIAVRGGFALKSKMLDSLLEE